MGEDRERREVGLKPEIVDYRPSWAEEYESIEKTVRAALGDLALRIDHIGSTSIPGLCAKDVIDVQATVEELADGAITVALTQVGYERRPFGHDHVPPGASSDPDEWTKLMYRSSRPVHLHVRVAGRANQRYPLLFRDYLRAHPNAAAAYGEFKRRLAALCADTGIYADAKDPVCDIIMQAAEGWADQTGWSR